jgi:uroporphyrinogen decarboxylase
MPVAAAKKRYGDKVAVLGGIDMNFLVTATVEQVEVYVKKVINECAPGGGYALGTGNSVANYIPVENYLAMLKVGSEFKY